MDGRVAVALVGVVAVELLLAAADEERPSATSRCMRSRCLIRSSTSCLICSATLAVVSVPAEAVVEGGARESKFLANLDGGDGLRSKQNCAPPSALQWDM